MPEKPSFEDYLRSCLRSTSATEFSLNVLITDEEVTFYIHPQDVDGETRDYRVEGDHLTCTTEFLPPPS